MKKSNTIHTLALFGAASAFALSAYALSDQDFGPGNSSEFAISSSERAYVVGVYGLSASNFAKRSDGFRAFSDSRIVDVEKHSGADADDHSMCSTYSDIDCLVWGGWTKQFDYASEDELAAAYLDGSAYSAIEALYYATEREGIDFSLQ